MTHPTFHLESFGVSDVGLVRNHNEDFWADYSEERLFILADGMGGHTSGEVASKEALTTLYRLFKQWNHSERSVLENAKQFFKEAFAQVNTSVYKKGESHAELKGMGTTLCSLFFMQDAAVLTHIGDSRIYLFRAGHLKQLTEDHSLVAELLALGAIKQEEAETFPYKHILTRAVGIHPQVECTVQSLAVESGDLFMLCSDGLTNYAEHQQMEEILNSDNSLEKKAQDLVHLAIEQGGGDNITLILSKVIG